MNPFLLGHVVNESHETLPASHARPASGAHALIAAAALAGALLGGAASAEAQSSGWVRGNPYDAISGGVDTNGRALLICMSDDPAWPGQHIGKRQAGWNYCSFGYGGEEITTGSYATLTPTWTRDVVGTPLGRDPSGNSQSVCHGWHEGGLHVGKQIDGHLGCSIGYGNAEVWLSEYAVLQQQGSFSLWASSSVSPSPRMPSSAVARKTADCSTRAG